MAAGGTQNKAKLVKLANGGQPGTSLGKRGDIRPLSSSSSAEVGCAVVGAGASGGQFGPGSDFAEGAWLGAVAVSGGSLSKP